MKRIALAAALCLSASPLAYGQTVAPWISRLKSPLTGTVVTADVIGAFFGTKANADKGTLTNATLSNALLQAAALDAASTAVTQPKGVSDHTVADTEFVQREIAAAQKVTLGSALASNTVTCTALTVGSVQMLMFAPVGNSCYNLTLAQANPVLSIGAPPSGTGQAISLYVTQPGTPVAWSAPTSTLATVRVSPLFNPTMTAGSTQNFDVKSSGDGNVFVVPGQTYPAGVALAYASNLSIDTPPQTTPGTAISLTGIETGGVSAALDYTSDGTTWTPIASPSIVNGAITVSLPALAIGTYTLGLRDHNNPTVAVANTGIFTVSPWTPRNLATSPNAYAVFASDPNDPALASADASGNLLTLASSINPALYMIPASGATGNRVKVTRAVGADGKHRLLQFHPSQTIAGAGDPNANWLTTGNLLTPGGFAGPGLLALANSANNATSGSYTIIVGEYFDTSATAAIASETGFSWSTLAKPGPLSFVQNVWNPSAQTFAVQLFDVANGLTTATSPAMGGYHVITTIKTPGTLTYRLDGKLASSQPILKTGGTAFDGAYADFMLGGSVGVGQSNESGTPPPFMGGVEAFYGQLQGSDLSNAELFVAGTMGLPISPVVPAPTGVATQIGVGAIASTSSGTSITVPYTYVGSLQAVNYSVNGGTPILASTAPVNGTGQIILPGGLTAGTYRITVCDINSTVCGISASFNVVQSQTYASAMVVTSVASTVPGSPITVKAGFTGGTGPTQAVDYQILVGGVGQGWVQAASPTFGTSTVSFTSTSGLPAGAYAIQTRDRNNVASASPAFAFTVAAPVSAGTATAINCASAPRVTTPGSVVSFTCTFAGNLTAVDYALTAGGTGLGWGTPSNVVITQPAIAGALGSLALTMPAGNSDVAGENTVQVRDHNAQGVLSQAIPVFTQVWTPNALAVSPGALLVWQIDAANPASVAAGGLTRVTNVINSSQFMNVMMGSGNVPVASVGGSGADQLHRAIAFSATKSTAYASGDPNANWLSGAGSAGSQLLTLANSPNLSTTGDFTIIEAAYFDTASSYTDFFGWGQDASPGPLQYIHLRYANATSYFGVTLDDAAQNFFSTGAAISPGWHVFDVIKKGNQIALHEDHATMGAITITSTSSLTAADFTIGGGFPSSTAANPANEFGAPPTLLSGALMYSGALQGTDLTNAEILEAASFGGK